MCTCIGLYMHETDKAQEERLGVCLKGDGDHCPSLVALLLNCPDSLREFRTRV